MKKLVTAAVTVCCIFWLSSAYAINWEEVDKAMDEVIDRISVEDGLDRTIREMEADLQSGDPVRVAKGKATLARYEEAVKRLGEICSR